MLDRLLSKIDGDVARILDKSLAGKEVGIEDGARLFETNNTESMALISIADMLRQQTVGDKVSFIHNPNINFTNFLFGKR